MAHNYNLKNPAIKRIMQEARELALEPCYEYEAHPLEDNIFEWHFTVRGPNETEFENGRYHGRILLPAEYPFKPPELIFLTPNGRFELNTKICLNITGYHPEFWQPAWGIRTVILAVMGFFPSEARGAIGGLEYSKEERKKLAKDSKYWTCSTCKMSNASLLTDSAPRGTSQSVNIPTDMPSFSVIYKNQNGQHVQNTPSSDKEAATNTAANPSSTTAASASTPTQQPSPRSHRPSIDHNTSSNRIETIRISVTSSQHSNNPGRPPLWLDGLILSLLTIIFALVVRRYLM